MKMKKPVSLWLIVWLCFLTTISLAARAQDPVSEKKSQPPSAPQQKTVSEEQKDAGQTASEESRVVRREVIVPEGTRIPLAMVNYVSSRNAKPGDQVYLETIFPITVNNRIVIPVGSYVRGTITEVERPGRVKGRAKMYIRFDSLTLPNGTTRDFNATLSGIDGRLAETHKEGEIKGEGTKGKDVGTVASTAAAGTGIGAIAGGVTGRPGTGIAIGAASGAIAGLILALSSRGEEIVLARGSELDMVLDRPLTFDEGELGGMIPPGGTVRPYRDRYAPADPTRREERKREREDSRSRDPYGRPRSPLWPY